MITTEEAIAKGIRRIVAITGPEAVKALKAADKLDKWMEDLDKEAKRDQVQAEATGDEEIIKQLGKKINEFEEVGRDNDEGRGQKRGKSRKNI